ncbi:MAG: HAMP domain-containing sensor histidine kinase [Chitinispirillia bacterium]|jgi:two-component system NtrC family sensor kinase
MKNRIKIVKNYVPFAQVWVYGNEIGQVILNLLTNAVDSIKDRGQIEIITENRGYFIFISIKDTGMGIADNILPHIFHPFFTTKHKGRSTGLGLYTSQEITKKHRGRLYVSETAVGKGTTFNFEVLKETLVNEEI